MIIILCILAEINFLLIRVCYHYNLFGDIHSQYRFRNSFAKSYPYILFTYIYISYRKLLQTTSIKYHGQAFHKPSPKFCSISFFNFLYYTYIKNL